MILFVIETVTIENLLELPSLKPINIFEKISNLTLLVSRFWCTITTIASKQAFVLRWIQHDFKGTRWRSNINKQIKRYICVFTVGFTSSSVLRLCPLSHHLKTQYSLIFLRITFSRLGMFLKTCFIILIAGWAESSTRNSNLRFPFDLPKNYGPWIRPTVGKIWPHPQLQESSDNFMVLRPNSFQFQVCYCGSNYNANHSKADYFFASNIWTR